MLKRLLLPVLVLGIASTACGDDTAGLADELTELELQTAVTAIFNRSIVQPVSLSTEIQGGPEAAPVEFADEVIETIDCSLGGSVESVIEIEGTVDDETEAAQLDFAVDQVHESCVETSTDSGVEVEIQGDPGIVGAIALDRDAEGAVTVGGGVLGSVTVTTESTSVTCTLDLQFEGSAARLQPVDYTFQGTFCGTGFQATFTG